MQNLNNAKGHSTLHHFVYDDMVIGTSPLMLLQANYLASKGRKVCVLDKSESFGGSWQVARLRNGEKVEIACHLIENFPGVYSFLEKLTSIPFVELDNQPVRVLESGMILPYLSKIILLLIGVRLFSCMFISLVKSKFGSDKSLDEYLNYSTKFKSFYRFQIKTIFDKSTIMGPKSGYVDFIESLIRVLVHADVKILCFDVQKICYDNSGYWVIFGKNSEILNSKQIHCTTSTNLRLTGPRIFHASENGVSQRKALLIEIPEEAINISQSYVAFWKDPLISRISRVDSMTTKSKIRFLVESRKLDNLSFDKTIQIVRLRLEKSKIIRPDASFEIVEEILCNHETNIDQLPLGCIEKNFKTYFSFGNLAAGIVAWLKLSDSEKM